MYRFYGKKQHVAVERLQFISMARSDFLEAMGTLRHSRTERSSCMWVKQYHKPSWFTHMVYGIILPT